MANEQTSVPLFVADTILTAAQQNISAGTGVPVFATTVTRDAGFGGANKALAEGQLCYLSASNIVQYYDGAAWATVGPAAAGGLVFIASGTVTAGASLSFDNCFSATYTNYLITINVSAGTVLSLRLRASGTDISAANYYVAGSFIAAGVQTIINITTQTSMKLSNGGNPVNVISTVFNPFAAFNTTFTNASQRADSGTFEATGCLYNASTSADGFSILGTTITVSARVYGYTNS